MTRKNEQEATFAATTTKTTTTTTTMENHHDADNIVQVKDDDNVKIQTKKEKTDKDLRRLQLNVRSTPAGKEAVGRFLAIWDRLFTRGLVVVDNMNEGVVDSLWKLLVVLVMAGTDPLLQDHRYVVLVRKRSICSRTALWFFYSHLASFRSAGSLLL